VIFTFDGKRERKGVKDYLKRVQMLMERVFTIQRFAYCTKIHGSRRI
jgi:hypothetical protein